MHKHRFPVSITNPDPHPLLLQLGHAGHSHKSLIVYMACMYAKSPESQLCPIRGRSARELCALPAGQTEMKKEWRKRERKRKKRFEGERRLWVKRQLWMQYEPMCRFVCRNVAFGRIGGEQLQLMQHEEGPLGLCFLLLWFPTDCLCPCVNRFSYASFPMVLCPVLASWWIELLTEEGVCLKVCRLSARQWV